MASFGLIVHGAFGGLIMLLWLWSVFDVVATDGLLVRNLPKGTWLFLTVFVPVVGVMAWIALGRPEGAGLSLGGQRRLRYEYDPARTAQTRVLGPEDSDSWRPNRTSSLPSSMQGEEPLAIRERKLLEREAELVRREADLAAAGEASTGATEDLDSSSDGKTASDPGSDIDPNGGDPS